MKQEMIVWQYISWTICRTFAPLCRQITTPAPQSFTQCFMGWMLFLLPNQQCQSTEGKIKIIISYL